MEAAAERQHAVELIGKLEGAQLAAIIRLLESMVDPVAHSMSTAPYEDEEITDELGEELARARGSEQHDRNLSHDEVLRRFGIEPR